MAWGEPHTPANGGTGTTGQIETANLALDKLDIAPGPLALRGAGTGRALDQGARMTEHVMDIGTDFIEGTWGVACSCGWDRSGYDTRDAAEDDWENHCDVVFMEATMRGVER